MNLQNYRLEPNPNAPGDWIVFGDDAGFGFCGHFVSP